MSSEEPCDYHRTGNWLRHWRRQIDNFDSVLDCPVEGCRTHDEPHTNFPPEIEFVEIQAHIRRSQGAGTLKQWQHVLLEETFQQRRCPHCEKVFDTYRELVIHEGNEHSRDKSTSTIPGFVGKVRDLEFNGGVWSEQYHLREYASVGQCLAIFLEGYTWYYDFFTFRAQDGSEITFDDWYTRRANAYHRASSRDGGLPNDMTRYFPFSEEEFLSFMSRPEYAEFYTNQVKDDVLKLKEKFSKDEI